MVADGAQPGPGSLELAGVAHQLAAAGCVAPEEEAAELTEAASGSPATLLALLARRVAGEPLAWVVGSVRFCGLTTAVDRGVYVPRWQSEPLARRAAALLPERGVAVDLCTGAGAIALVLARRRPRARVVATDIDSRALACARRNGVEAYEGDLGAPVPAELVGRVDIVSAVVPYVPTAALRLLPRDVLAFEPRHALDGGPDGTDVLLAAATDGARLLRQGGTLLLELGGDQAEEIAPELDRLGYLPAVVGRDQEGDVRFLAARRRPTRRVRRW